MADIDDYNHLQDSYDEDGFFEELRTLVSQDEILNIIQQLPEGYRMVFNLFAIEGYSHQEIADMLDVSVNTSKTQLFKARQQIIGAIRKIASDRLIVRNVI
jgi:RNA polymerase sigma-70 factor (ECF subfamily)